MTRISAFIQYLKYLPIILALTSISLKSQDVRIHTDSLPILHSEALNPGFFYNNTTSAANNIFNNSGFHCNSLRLTDISWFLRSSTSFSQVISNVQAMQGLYQFRATFTNKVILTISGMPAWLSSSSNGSSTCGNWYYYQTVKPSSYALWDSLMKSIAIEISAWGIEPHYEIWNEPDLTCYWNGTEAELIELYVHTANAIKSADPTAKVGGLAVNGWHSGINSPYNNVVGYIPPSIADNSSVVAHLIDTCVAQSVPLDFITFHFFSVLKGKFGNAMSYFKNKLAFAGLPNCEIFITEYNGPSAYRETPLHPPFVLECYDEFQEHDIFFHDIASLQDFTLNPNREFFSDYGCITRNGIKKPIFNTLYLLNKVRSLGYRLSVEKPNEIFSLASLEHDTLRLLISNHVPYPLWGGRNELFFGSSPINTIDLTAAGYTSWSQVDSTISGAYPPIGPPNVLQAFKNANQYYLWAVAHYSSPDTLELRFIGWEGDKTGRTILLDATHNNSVFVYDSLIGVGYSNSAAIQYLLANQQLVYNNVVVNDSIWTTNLLPNSVLYMEVYDAILVSAHQEVNNQLPLKYLLSQNYPNPFNNLTVIYYSVATEELVTIKVYNIIGEDVATLVNEHKLKGNYKVKFDTQELPSGIYFYRLQAGSFIDTKKMILLK